MKLFARTSSFFLLIFLMMFSCRRVYEPPVIKGNNHFLAVDGFIYTGNGVSTMITLSRSVNLDEAGLNLPELNAQVTIQSSGGNSYNLIDSNGSGIYLSSASNLDTAQQYRLAITTSDGNKFQSDFVSSKPAPPIDSVTWELVDDPLTLQQAVNIYINAHDPANTTRFYRWDYLETYKHLSTYTTAWGESNGMVFPLPTGYDTHNCWSESLSRDILLGTTNTLSQDVVSHIQIVDIQQNDPILDVGCSFLVRQYPLTDKGYTYWLNVQKNSQSLGGLSDLQPAQISGNLHCITDPAITVLGFISASTVQEQRIYISNKSLPGWQSLHVDTTSTNCKIKFAATDPLNTLVYNYLDTSYAPYFFSSGILIVAPKSCLDCRYQGGTITKPAFWPLID